MTFVFSILDFNTFLFLWRTSLKTTCLRDGCFLLKDCFIILLLLLLKVRVYTEKIQVTKERCISSIYTSSNHELSNYSPTEFASGPGLTGSRTKKTI